MKDGKKPKSAPPHDSARRQGKPRNADKAPSEDQKDVDAQLDEELEDSFPASDPPSLTEPH